MMKILFLLAFSFPWIYCSAQNTQQNRLIDSSYYALRIDSLRQAQGNFKKIPAQYELEILIALSYYPELDSTPIQFKKAKIKTTMNAQPRRSTLFKKRKKRSYIIRINNRKRDSIILLEAVPFNGKIGIIGHELAHLIDYRNKNISGIMNRLWAYTRKKTKEKFEKEIDYLTIKRGLGWQLYDWANFVQQDSKATQKYKAFKRNIYLEPQEIEQYIEKNYK